MGEAKNRGTYEDRKLKAITNKVDLLTKEMVDMNDPNMYFLKQGYEFLKNALHPDDWNTRRAKIIDYLKSRPTNYAEKNARVRFKEDEITWYIFLCEEFFKFPLISNPSQMARISPLIIRLGSHVNLLKQVENIDKKLKELVKKYRNNPDGVLFELIVAASYLDQGYEVKFIEESAQQKKPDLFICKGDEKYYIECKRLQQRTDYADKERGLFLESWTDIKCFLLENFPNFWFDINIKCELVDNNKLELMSKFSQLNPRNNRISYSDDEIDMVGERQNIEKINKYLSRNYVKYESYVFAKLLGDNLVYGFCERTYDVEFHPYIISLASAPIMGMMVGKINKFIGVTRHFTNSESMSKKSREIKRHVSEAITQLEEYKPSIVHVLYEAMEDAIVENLRWSKIEEKMKELESGLDVNTSVKVHRLQYYESEKLFDICETIKVWGRELQFKPFVIIPNT